MNTRNEQGLIIAAMISLYFIWGSTYLGILWALEGFSTFMLGGIRFLIAGILLLVVLALRGTPLPSPRQWLNAGAVGILLLVGGNGGVMIAEHTVSSGLVAVVVASVPLWAALFAGLFGRWPTRLEWVGLVIGFVGVAALVLEGDFRANPLSMLIVVGGTMCWSFGSVWGRRLEMPKGLMASAAQMVMAGVAFMVISIASGEPILAPTPRAIGALIYLITFGSLIGYTAYGYLLSKVRTTLATSYAYVNPIVAILLGVGLAGESITWLGIGAMVVILASVAMLAVARDRESKPVAPVVTPQRVAAGD